MMSKYEERDEEEPGMLYDGTEAYKIYANVLPEHIKLIETQNRKSISSSGQNPFLTMRPNWIGKPNWNYVSTAGSTPIKLTVAGVIGAIARRELSLRFSELCQPQYIIYIRRTGSRTLPTTAAGPFSAYPRTGE